MNPEPEKTVHHGVHVVDQSGPPDSNPPPYIPGPPPGAYAPAMTTGAIVIPGTVVTRSLVGPKPATIVCPSCRAQIVTRIEHRSSTKTHLMALLLCVVFCPCVCLPYCTDSCQNTEHYCPNCSSYLGAYEY